MLGKWAKTKETAATKLTVTLPAELAGILSGMASDGTQDESEIVTELLTEALIYCRGWNESKFPENNTLIMRMANALLVQAIDSGVDTLQIVPTQANLRLRYLYKGKLWEAAGAELTSEIPLRIKKPLFTRYEHMARPASGRAISHPDALEQGLIPVTHSGSNYTIGLRFLAREPGATGETLELTFPGAMEEP